MILVLDQFYSECFTIIYIKIYKCYIFYNFLGYFLKKFLLHLTAKASISALYDFALLKYFGSIQLTCFLEVFTRKSFGKSGEVMNCKDMLLLKVSSSLCEYIKATYVSDFIYFQYRILI